MIDLQKMKRTSWILKHLVQARSYVPFSDFKLYQQARKYNADYRSYLRSHGKKFLKNKRRVDVEQSMVFGRIM
jgi:hypothetical protein